MNTYKKNLMNKINVKICMLWQLIVNVKYLIKMCDYKYKKRLYLVDPQWKIYDPYQSRWNINHIPDEERDQRQYP